MTLTTTLAARSGCGAIQAIQFTALDNAAVTILPAGPVITGPSRYTALPGATPAPTAEGAAPAPETPGGEIQKDQPKN